MTKGKRLPHYIGVTGIQSEPEVIDCVQSYAQWQALTQHTLMLGILVSPSTVDSKEPLYTTKPFRHVKSFAALISLLRAMDDSPVLGMLHMELSKAWPGNRDDAAAVIQLFEALRRENLKAPVQLNGLLGPEIVKEVCAETGATVVLQLRSELSEQGELHVLRYTEKLAETADRILIDPSAGAGEVINIELAIEWQQRIQREFPGIFSFGYAGGFSAATAQQALVTKGLIEDLGSAFGNKEFSLDIETGVRKACGKEDTLSLELVQGYFKVVSEAFDNVS